MDDALTVLSIWDTDQQHVIFIIIITNIAKILSIGSTFIYVNFGNSSGEKNGEKRKIINAAVTGNRIRDPSITDQISVLTN